jgi:hypothetical protein
MRPCFTLALSIGVLDAFSRETSAHGVVGDADPGDRRYLLVGALVTPVLAPRDTDRGTLDVGIECNLHKFVPAPGRQIWTQWGYGLLGQGQLGGLPLGADSPYGAHLRFGAGGYGSLGPFVLQGGLWTRLGMGRPASNLGAFGGVAFSIGFVSFGVQVEAAFLRLSSERQAWTFTFPLTLKWPFELAPEAPPPKSNAHVPFW